MKEITFPQGLQTLSPHKFHQAQETSARAFPFFPFYFPQKSKCNAYIWKLLSKLKGRNSVSSELSQIQFIRKNN